MRPARRSRPRRPTRWRPGLEALEQHILLSGANLVVSSAVAPTTLYARDRPGQLGRDQPRDRGGRRELVGRRLPLERRGARRRRHAPGQPAGRVDDPGSGRELHQGRQLHRPRRRLGRLLPALRRRFRRRPGRGRRVRQRPRRTGHPGRLIHQAPRPDRHRRDGAEHGPSAISTSRGRSRTRGPPTSPATGPTRSTCPPTRSTTHPTPFTSYYHFNSLAAGASQSFNTTINLPSVPAGSYYLLVVADGYNSVTESDETNNVRAVPITLTVPDVDLIVTAADAPATAKAGGTADSRGPSRTRGPMRPSRPGTMPCTSRPTTSTTRLRHLRDLLLCGRPDPAGPGRELLAQRHDHAPLGPGRLVLPAVRRRQQPQPGRDRRDEQRPRRPDHAHAPRRRPGGHGPPHPPRRSPGPWTSRGR